MKKSLILVAIISTFFCQAQKIVETIDGEFKYPTGVTADSQGNIYIADTQNDKIKIWNIGSKKLQVLEKADALYPQHMVTDFTSKSQRSKWQGMRHFPTIIKYGVSQ